MAKDVADTVKDAVADAVNDIGKTLEDGIEGLGDLKPGRKAAAAAAVAALAPLAAKGASKLAGEVSTDGVAEAVKAPGKAASGVGEKLASGVGEKISSGISGKVEEKIGQAGGPGGILKGALKNALPFGGGDGKDQDGDNQVRGIGDGRRMPVQQWIDVAVPLQTVYNQWTQFEEWPQFMHRVTRVTQEDPCTVSFATKIWAKTYEFKAQIVTQRPDELVKWEVTEGITHTGWVTFHELGPRLTRIELSMDVDPGSLIQKFARGARHVKRAARGDMHRFKAYIEALEKETGEWRGTIEDGKVKRQRQSRRQSENGSSSGSSGRRAQNGSSSRTRSASSGRGRAASGRSRSRGD